MEQGNSREQRVKGASEEERVFRKKFEGTRRADTTRTTSTPSKEPGYIARKKAEAKQLGRKTWNVTAGDPLKEDPKQELTYEVKNGKLTVTDQDGRVVKEIEEKGLERYNGVVMKGEGLNKDGEVEVKASILDRIKMKEENQYSTPREEQEFAEEQAEMRAMKPLKMGQKIHVLKDLPKKAGELKTREGWKEIGKRRVLRDVERQKKKSESKARERGRGF